MSFAPYGPEVGAAGRPFPYGAQAPRVRNGTGPRVPAWIVPLRGAESRSSPDVCARAKSACVQKGYTGRPAAGRGAGLRATAA
ncbi:hypothetical protein SSBG_00034 [Streptomyces sp. SPB074]|nr:hypothetical protein SSBG_00034 [Streptomyces sp. SPB074]